MPLYTYECSEHGQFDGIKSIHDETPMVCPQCQKVAKKVVTLFAIRRRETSMGTTREELFNNLAQEGLQGKDWKDYDNYYHRAKGIES